MNPVEKTDLRSIKETVLFPARRAVNYLRHLTTKENGAPVNDVIVSLTTYPNRFHSCVHTVRSILRQTCKPYRTELYISREEANIHSLPHALAELADAGLHIEFVNGNTGSYKKLIPALERWPNKTIVTADDDKLYPPTWLSQLVSRHREMPDTVLCHRARLMTGKSDSWKPYSDWVECHSSMPASGVFPIGVGGVLYPPDCFHPDVFNMDKAMALAPSSDDIWFKVMAWRNRTPHCQVTASPQKYYSVPNLSGGRLYERNVVQGGNDAALATLADLYGFVPGSVLGQYHHSADTVCD